jgi:hypothetical protein
LIAIAGSLASSSRIASCSFARRIERGRSHSARSSIWAKVWSRSVAPGKPTTKTRSPGLAPFAETVRWCFGRYGTFSFA